MDRLFFVVNPVAGNGRSAKEFIKVEQALKAKDADYGIAYTTRPGQATELSLDALARGERNIVAVGGDGTVNEVAAALVGKDATLGILPLGTGNDLARTIGIPKDALAALDLFLAGKRKPIDAGSVNGHTFINAAGTGFDVDTVIATERYKRRFPRFKGMLPFLLGVMETLMHLRTLNLTITADDGAPLHMEALVMVVANGVYIGGGMKAAPMADPFDGYLDVCIVERVNVLNFLRFFPLFIKGKHVSLPMVTWLKVKTLSVACDEQSALQLDGDPKLTTPVTFTVLPAAMQVFVP